MPNATQPAWLTELLTQAVALATELGLPGAAYRAALESGRYAQVGPRHTQV
ncbi:hypothetical protein [Nonomuraea turcica]|uniref:hypothetical protein n=1 Tax=Nonomuraea sp. G32 TaxID=3067274 RepID=UPI00273ACDE7|nr:hypothetical protein [Nonomuraea sp. G32]MDP4500907.1 hypothetical protein [Nonomuraea sp. G32]